MRTQGFQALPKPYHLDRLFEEEEQGIKGKGRKGKGKDSDDQHATQWPPRRLRLPNDLWELRNDTQDGNGRDHIDNRDEEVPRQGPIS